MTPRSPHGPILVGYDGSDESRDALALAKQLARATDSRLLLGWIEPVGPFDLPHEVVLEPIQERAERALDEIARDLRDQGFEVGTRVGLLGSAAQGIHELAESDAAELIVVGSSHRGRIGRAIAGTVGKRLLHGAPCPVAIAPRGFAQARRRERTTLGVAYDGSPEARAALEEARYLALKLHATLKVIAVAEVIGPPHPAVDAETLSVVSRERAQAWLHEARVALRDDFTVATYMAVGDPGRRLEAASVGLDLLVVGSRGYGPVRRVVLGSASSHLVEHCDCPLVVVPRGAEVSDVPHRVLFSSATAS